MTISRRLLAVFLAFGLLVAACGDDDSGDETTEESQSTDGDNEAQTGEDGSVTIEHAYGETVIEGVPEKIVSLGAQWNGVLLDMGVTPIAYLDDGYTENGIYPWEEGLIGEDATALPQADGLNFEQIDSLDPDLIVVTHVVTDQATYDTLAAIAPTIPALSTAQVDTWQDLTTVAGKVLHDEARAQEILDEYDAMVAGIAADLPGLAGKTYSFANYVPGDSIYIVADPEDGSTKFFADLGLEIAPEIIEAADGVSGRAQVSLEEVELLAADLVLILANGADTSDIIGFEQLEAVEKGAYASVDFNIAVAMNTPSAMSLTWAVDQIRPALEAAAG